MRTVAALALLTAAQALRPAVVAEARLPAAQSAVAAAAATPVPDARPSFSEWLSAVRAEAVSRGIKPEIVDAALSGVEEPVPVILERDRAQAETVFSLEHYLSRRLTARVIKTGREAFTQNRDLLEEVGTAYAVPPRIIAAIWGVESNYGRFSGLRPTVAALATLAWDPRRATFFRGELFDALQILNRGDIELGQMKGSWAGAMGQVQFMPSSYLKFAEDYDGDGRRDIWSNPADVFASIANYLSSRGWTSGDSWGREVSVSTEAERKIRADVAPRAGTCQATRNMSVPLPSARWKEMGVRLSNGKPLPAGDIPLALVSGSTRHFLVTPNYDAILDYNCSHSYAITVALLGDAIASTGKVPAQPAPKSKSRPAGKAHPGAKKG